MADRNANLLTPSHKAHKMRATKTLYNSDLAQLVEQMTVNHWVAGSSPAVGAIQGKGSHLCGPLLFLQETTLCWIGHAGLETRVNSDCNLS